MKHDAHDAHDSDAGSHRPFFVNQPRGGAKPYTVSPTGPTVKIVAKGRAKWSGWAESVRGDIGWDAVENTARVIAEVNADILPVPRHIRAVAHLRPRRVRGSGVQAGTAPSSRWRSAESRCGSSATTLLLGRVPSPSAESFRAGVNARSRVAGQG